MGIPNIGLFKKSSNLIVPYDANHLYSWQMQDLSGTTVTDSISGQNGTATSGLVITTGYKNWKLCRQFDGSKMITTPVKFPQGAKTIRFKIKCTQTPTSYYWTILDSSAGYGYNWGMYIGINTSGQIAIYSFKGVVQNLFQVTSSANICNGQWHDIQLTWDGGVTANSVLLYIKVLSGTNAGKWISDASVVNYETWHARATATSSEAYPNAYNVLIGASNDTTYRFYANYTCIEDFQVANVVLNMNNYP